MSSFIQPGGVLHSQRSNMATARYQNQALSLFGARLVQDVHEVQECLRILRRLERGMDMESCRRLMGATEIEAFTSLQVVGAELGGRAR